jgi:hypothetical protein
VSRGLNLNRSKTMQHGKRGGSLKIIRLLLWALRDFYNFLNIFSVFPFRIYQGKPYRVSIGSTAVIIRVVYMVLRILWAHSIQSR